MEYIIPYMEIIEFDENIGTTVIQGSNGTSTGSNEPSTDLGNSDVWAD